MKNKKLAAVLMFSLATISLTGCMEVHSDLNVDKNNNVTMSSKLYVDKEEFDTYVGSLASLGGNNSVNADFDTSKTVKLHGKDYYVSEEVKTFNQKELKKEIPSGFYTSNRFYYYTPSLTKQAESLDLGATFNSQWVDYIELDVSFPDAVKETNGVVSKDSPKIAKFVLDTGKLDGEQEFYAWTGKGTWSLTADRAAAKKATTAKTPVDTESNLSTIKPLEDKHIKILGLKNGKTYKKKATGYIKLSKSSKFWKVTVNGVDLKATKVKKGKHKGQYKFIVKGAGHKVVSAYTRTMGMSIITINLK